MLCFMVSEKSTVSSQSYGSRTEPPARGRSEACKRPRMECRASTAGHDMAPEWRRLGGRHPHPSLRRTLNSPFRPGPFEEEKSLDKQIRSASHSSFLVRSANEQALLAD